MVFLPKIHDFNQVMKKIQEQLNSETVHIVSVDDPQFIRGYIWIKAACDASFRVSP